MRSILMLLVAFSLVSAKSQEILNISVADGAAKARLKYSEESIWHELRGDAKIDHLLDIHEKITAVEGTPYTPAMLGIKSSFNLGNDTLGFGCKNFDFDFSLSPSGTFKFDYNLNCYLHLFPYDLYWYEKYSLLIAEDQLKFDGLEVYGLNKDNINFITVGADYGCLFRSGDSYDAEPIARAKVGTRIVIGPDIKANRGWAKAYVDLNEEGWLEGYVGSRLMTELSGQPTAAVHVKEKIPPLKDLGNQ